MRRVVCLILFFIPLYAKGQSRIYLLDKGKGDDRHVVYIDNNRAVKDYNIIGNFKFSVAEYKESLDILKGNTHHPLAKTLLAGMPLKWCSLRVYKNKYYVYSPSDAGYDNYRIAFNDSTSVEYGFELYTSAITKFNKSNNKTYTINCKNAERKVNTITIHIIDAQKGIAIFEYSDRKDIEKYMLMVRAENIRQFPVIINYCKANRTEEWEFDKPDFKKLLAGK